jgi:hypothetical protein
MARQKRTLSENYSSKLQALCTKALEEYEKAPETFSGCSVQKITIERWGELLNTPNPRTFEHFLNFLRLTQSQWDDFLDGKMDFEEFWASRGKSTESRIITFDSCINDIRTLSYDERMQIIAEIVKMSNNTIEKVNFITLNSRQLKRLKTLLMFSRASLGDQDLETFKDAINTGANQSMITAIVDQKIMGFPKEDYEALARFLLKPSQWVNDDFLMISNQAINSFSELMAELG